MKSIIKFAVGLGTIIAVFYVASWAWKKGGNKAQKGCGCSGSKSTMPTTTDTTAVTQPMVSPTITNTTSNASGDIMPIVTSKPTARSGGVNQIPSKKSIPTLN